MALNIAVLGAGFIGKNLLASCIARGDNVRVLDRNPRPAEFEPIKEWVQGSFMNGEDIVHAVRGADIVFHLISSTVPGDTIDENEEIFNNVIQTINLLRICVQENVKRIIFISSSAVYGLQRRLPIPEIAVTDTITSIGIHKLTVDKYLHLYKFEYGLDCKIMRLSNPYGIGQKIFGRQGIIAIAIGKVLYRSPIMIRGEGTAIRDFIYIDDVINACHLLAATDSDEVTFNIGSGRGIYLNDVIKEMSTIIGRELPVIYSEARKNDIPASILDISRAKRILGFEVTVSFSDGLRRTLSFYENYNNSAYNQCPSP